MDWAGHVTSCVTAAAVMGDGERTLRFLERCARRSFREAGYEFVRGGLVDRSGYKIHPDDADFYYVAIGVPGGDLSGC